MGSIYHNGLLVVGQFVILIFVVEPVRGNDFVGLNFVGLNFVVGPKTMKIKHHYK